jgi:hypothetical protein
MKKTIKGTAKLLNVSEGNVSLKYDKDIVNWFKQFGDNEDAEYEVIYMNYEKVAKDISKLVGVEFDDYIDYPYWDEHYTHCMDFHTDEKISDAKIKKALKGKVFTVKLKAERYF